RDRLVVLRDLEVLRHVRIEVVLPCEPAPLRDLAVQRQPDANRRLHGRPVEHRQRSRQAQAHRAHLGVRRCAELCPAAAEHLGRRPKLDMNLQTEHGLVPADRLVERGKRRGRRRGHSPPPSRCCLISRTSSATVVAIASPCTTASSIRSLSFSARASRSDLTIPPTAKAWLPSRTIILTCICHTTSSSGARASSGPPHADSRACSTAAPT